MTPNIKEILGCDYSKDMVDSFAYTTTIALTPPCPHANGWYNTIPARLWGRRSVFVCTDCGDILEPIGKKERV